MAARLRLAPHLTHDEIFERYRSCKHACEKSRWHVIWLKSQQKTTAFIAETTGFKTDWVRRIIRRYNEFGSESLRDGRFKNGRTSILDMQMQKELYAALQNPSADGGLWNSRKVSEWISKRMGKPIRTQRGWEYLQRLDMTLQRPRPRNALADQAKQDDFKKNFP